MSSSDQKSDEVFTFSSPGSSVSPKKVKEPTQRYSVRRGSGQVKRLRTAAILARRRKWGGGVRIAEYVSSDDEKKVEGVDLPSPTHKSADLGLKNPGSVHDGSSSAVVVVPEPLLVVPGGNPPPPVADVPAPVPGAGPLPGVAPVPAGGAPVAAVPAAPAPVPDNRGKRVRNCSFTIAEMDESLAEYIRLLKPNDYSSDSE